MEVAAVPGTESTVATLQTGESTLFSGTSALASDGQTWLEMLDPETAAQLGWVPAQNWGDVRRNRAQDSTFAPSDQLPSSSTTYGAPLPAISVSIVACNAVQIEIQNPSNTLGMAFVFASEIPFAQVGAVPEVWQGSRLFVDPGDSTTLTLLNNETTTWYFASLDDDGRAVADRGPTGALNGAAGSSALAIDTQQVLVNAGTCSFIPEVSAADLADQDYEFAETFVEEELVEEDVELEEEGADALTEDGAEADVDDLSTVDAGTEQANGDQAVEAQAPEPAAPAAPDATAAPTTAPPATTAADPDAPAAPTTDDAAQS